MVEQLDSTGTGRGISRLRYLIDILVVLITSAVLQTAAAAIYNPGTLQAQLVFSSIIQFILLGIAWLLIRLRGERLAEIGLKSPENWARAIIIGMAYAVVVFIAMYLIEKAGIRRNLSAFRDVQGSVELTMYGILYSFIGAGFYEEFMFRGFLFNGLAMLLGASRRAWIGAWLIQGALFGAAHAYQSSTGMVITGVLGLTMGWIVLISGGNLWPVIIGHGLYDAGRFVLFYFQGPPVG